MFSVGKARFKVLCALGEKMVYFEKALFMLGGTAMVASDCGFYGHCAAQLWQSGMHC